MTDSLPPPPPLQLPATTNLFDSFGVSMNMVNPNGPAAAGGAGAGPLVIPQMSASCPANVKEERDLTMMHACKLIDILIITVILCICYNNWTLG